MYELDKLSKFYRCWPSKLTCEQLQDYVLQQINQGFSVASTNLAVASLRMFYIRVLKDPQRVESLVRRKTSDRLSKVIAESQVRDLIATTHNLRYRAAIQLAYSTGLRVSEVVSLQVQDIDSTRQMIFVRSGKGGHERLVFLPVSLLEALHTYYRLTRPKPES